MAGCDTSPHNDLYESGERRVLGWVGGGALGLATYGGIEAATFGALTGPQILMVLAAIAALALAGAVLGFFVGFAVLWFDRLHVQTPSTITMAGCVFCAGQNTGIPPFTRQ